MPFTVVYLDRQLLNRQTAPPPLRIFLHIHSLNNTSYLYIMGRIIHRIRYTNSKTLARWHIDNNLMIQRSHNMQHCAQYILLPQY